MGKNKTRRCILPPAPLQLPSPKHLPRHFLHIPLLSFCPCHPSSAPRPHPSYPYLPCLPPPSSLPPSSFPCSPTRTFFPRSPTSSCSSSYPNSTPPTPSFPNIRPSSSLRITEIVSPPLITPHGIRLSSSFSFLLLTVCFLP